MARLFKRIARVSCWRENVPADATKFEVIKVGDVLEINDLRIQFEISKKLPSGKRRKSHPNTCDITITNLAQRTRADLETKPLLVQLDAGYDDVPRRLFVGDLRFGMTKMDGPNWETLLQLGDADCHHRWSRVNKSYGPGVTVRQVLKDSAASLGLALPATIENDDVLDSEIIGGDVSYGATRDKFTDLLAPYGYSWSIQDGQLRILRDDQVQSNSPIPIDEEHGMIGTPEFGSPPKSGKPPHMTVKMLLYPALNPGDLVYVTSKVKSGYFKIQQVRHRGDTHGGDWTTEIEIKPVSVNPGGKGKPAKSNAKPGFAGASASGSISGEI